MRGEHWGLLDLCPTGKSCVLILLVTPEDSKPPSYGAPQGGPSSLPWQLWIHTQLQYLRSTQLKGSLDILAPWNPAPPREYLCRDSPMGEGGSNPFGGTWESMYPYKP